MFYEIVSQKECSYQEHINIKYNIVHSFCIDNIYIYIYIYIYSLLFIIVAAEKLTAALERLASQ